MNYIQKKIRQFQESAWLLGICESGYDDLKAGRIHWIDNGEYKGKKWFADPFILDYDEEQITLLVEEFDYKVHRGRIARLIVDRSKWRVTDCKIILDLSTHLSFPMIWREEGRVYVCPENYKSGQWKMYEYDKKENTLQSVGLLLDEPLTDATLYKDNGYYYILSTYDPTPNGQKLTIWKSESLKSEFIKTQDVLFEENIARNAGMVFKDGDRLIRPSQECNKTYGHAITFQHLQKGEDDRFIFNVLWRMTSPHPGRYDLGIHTYNQHTDGMAVIDVKGWRYPIIGPLINGVGNMLVELGLKKAYRPQ